MQVNGETRKILISGILSVPGLECNLFSVRKLEVNGFKVIFENGKGVVQKANTIVAVARVGKLYKILFEYHMETANLCEADGSKLASSIGSPQQHWNKKACKNGRRNKIKRRNSEPCEICVEGKQTR